VRVLAVTVLTSLGSAELEEVGTTGTLQDQVMRLAELALGAGVSGLVCSALEVPALRARFGGSSEEGPLIVVPAIRAPGAPADDQRRALSAREAIDAGADIIVVGRPITGATDPGAAARRLALAVEV
jgi:orotidine-5'-phosphate decarboxylase